MSKIDDEKTLQYIAGFKRYSTERVMKSLVGEFTQNEKWSVKGVHKQNQRCNKFGSGIDVISIFTVIFFE